MGKALDEIDMDALSEIYHDDYQFTLHSAGKILYKKDVLDWIAMDDIISTNYRILYENDEIGSLMLSLSLKVMETFKVFYPS